MDLDPGLQERFDALRKDLEADYAAQRRQAKLREKRLRDALQRDREEWEVFKADERKRLADLAETLRRREENAARQERSKAEAQAELTTAKVEVDEERRRLEAQGAALEARVEAMKGQIAALCKDMRTGALWVAVLAAVAMVAAWAGSRPWGVTATVLLLFVAALLGGRSSVRAPPGDGTRT